MRLGCGEIVTRAPTVDKRMACATRAHRVWAGLRQPARVIIHPVVRYIGCNFVTILRPGDPPPTSPKRYPIHARSGWEIPQPTEEIEVRSPEIMRIRGQEWQAWRRGVTLRSASSHPYNCVGMIFASRRAVIEIDHIYDILREDGYRRIQLRDVVVGDMVLYRDTVEPTHVALVTAIDAIGDTLSVRVLSKWGLDPEFEHFMENVPARLGVPMEFYTERQV